MFSEGGGIEFEVKRWSGWVRYQFNNIPASCRCIHTVETQFLCTQKFGSMIRDDTAVVSGAVV